MGISSIVQIAERLLSGNFGQDPQDQAKRKAADTTSRTNQTDFGDRFTRSENADSANATSGTGVLQVEQLRFTALNIQAPTGHAGGATIAGAPAATPVASVTSPGNAGPANPAAAPVVAAANAPAAAAAQPANTGATTTPTQTQQDLQTLNSALTALGLNAAEIAAFDQYAGILLQFDPNALQLLESQLNLLAAKYQTQNAPAVAAASTGQAAASGPTSGQVSGVTPATGPANTPASGQTAATNPGFQLTELSITFTGVKETLNQGGQGNGNAKATQVSAFSLQIQEVRVSLTNPAGQTTQLQVPQATSVTSTGNTGTTTTPVSKAAAG
jgi:hypothetical protein